jgi:hypothetical protein
MPQRDLSSRLRPSEEEFHAHEHDCAQLEEVQRRQASLPTDSPERQTLVPDEHEIRRSIRAWIERFATESPRRPVECPPSSETLSTLADDASPASRT